VRPRRRWWWGRKRRKAPSAGDYFTDAFMKAVMQQLKLLRSPLASVEAIRFPRPVEFMQAPTSRILAELQAAYWLAVASRIALGQGNHNAARRLAEGAHLFVNRVKSGRHNDIATTVNEVRQYISTTGSQQLPQAVLDLYNAPEGNEMAGYYSGAHYGAVNLVYGQDATLEAADEEVEAMQASMVPPAPMAARWLVAAAVLIPVLASMGATKR
tara:strand:+ start:819 stop:1457 length:639 start_codon:yes stop_codon:yes gene_type:complete